MSEKCVACGVVTANYSIRFKTFDGELYCHGCLLDVIIDELERLKTAYIRVNAEIHYES